MRANQPHFIYSKVIEKGPDECWPWSGRVTYHGYGSFDIAGKSIRAHRYIYELEHGPILPGLEVMHLCSNRLCCNPAHLKLGTHAENMRTRRGKLNPDEIAEIRDSHLCQDELAEIYGVNQSTISRIRSHKRLYRNGA